MAELHDRGKQATTWADLSAIDLAKRSGLKLGAAIVGAAAPSQVAMLLLIHSMAFASA